MILGAAFVVKDTNEGSNVDARFTATLNPWSLRSFHALLKCCEVAVRNASGSSTVVIRGQRGEAAGR